jgi:hypothetical protein
MPSTSSSLRFGALVLLAGAGCSIRPTGQPSALEREAQLAAGVLPERAASRVRALCALGPRMGGTRSGADSAEFLRLSFAALGLDVRVERDPELWAHAERDWQVAAHGPGGVQRVLERAWPYGFSPSASGSAELTLVARPGAVLLHERGLEPDDEPRPALVLVDGATTLDGSYPVVAHLDAEGPAPVAHFGLARDEGRLLRDWLAQGHAVRVDFRLTAEVARAEALTVVARLPAREPRGRPWTEDHFLFCAHGDSDAGGPGADDNASGIATVLEIATAWTDAIARGLVDPPEREVRFAVWGAEIHSSRAYLARCGPEYGELLGVVNFDQSGFGSSADRIFVEPDDLPANAELTRTLLAVLRDHAPRRPGGEDTRAPSTFPLEWASVPSLGGTDSYVFSKAERFRSANLPALTVYSSAWGRPDEHARTPGMPGESWNERDSVAVDYDIYYHSAGDTPANTTDREPWNMAWCARVSLLAARRYLAGSRQAP